MLGISGDVVKNLRKQLNLTQEAFAEKTSMSTRNLYRLENNQTELDVFEYMDILHGFNISLDDFFMTFFDNREYLDYRIYRDAFRYNRLYNFSKWRETILELENRALMDNPYIQQCLAYCEVRESVFTRETNPGIYTMDDLEALLRAMRITIKDFDETKVADYLLAIQEPNILIIIVETLCQNGQYERAENICNGLLNNLSIKHRKEYMVMVRLMLVSTIYTAERYNDALNMASEFLVLSANEREYSQVANLLYIAMYCSKKLGKDESVCKAYFIKSYYLTVLQGVETNIAQFKHIARDIFDTELEDLIKWPAVTQTQS